MRIDTIPNRRYHPFPVKLINWVTRRLNSVGLATTDLSEEALTAAAKAETGLSRFANECFQPGLRALLRSLENDAELTPFGRLHAKAGILGSLKNRLWADACFDMDPDVRQRKIEKPVVIVGPVRSGTTRIQRMLATDTRLQHMRAWEGFNPAPRPGTRALGRAAREREVKKFLRAGHRLNPGAFAAHPMEADWAEEEILLLNHSFAGLSPVGLYHVPAFYNWLLEHDKSDAYRYMADLLNLISWSRGDDESKRWILKTPQHMLDLDVLLRVFPGAKLIFTHRDPIKTVASSMSLAWHFSVQHTDLPRRVAIRDTWLDLSELMARRCSRSREAIPRAQQLDVHYDEMNRDWLAVVRRIYDFIEVELTTQAEQALGEWLAKSERENRHGAHRYSLEDFGVTRIEVDDRMKFYREQYAIPYED